MKTKTRFIQSVIRTAQSSNTQMPWARQPRDAATTGRRQSPVAPTRVRTA